MFNLKAECENCETEIIVNGNVLKDKFVPLVETKESIRIMYYVCKKCGHLHIVQLDTKETLNKLEKLKKIAHKISIGKTKSTDKFDRLKNDLAVTRMELVKKCNGKHYINELGNEVELIVSVVSESEENKPNEM